MKSVLPFLAFILLALAAPASGQSGGKVICPVDRARLPIKASVPWNVAGGIDSDGCIYAIDANGRRRVVGLDQLLSCPTCHLTLRQDHFNIELDRDTISELKTVLAAALKDVPMGGEPLRLPVLYELSALCYRTLGPEHFKGLEVPLPELVADLLLRGAWAARGAAVLNAEDGGYRPQNLAQAKELLQGLESRIGIDPTQTREIRSLDEELAELERTRSEYRAPLLAGDLHLRLSLLRSHETVARIERDLLARKQLLKTEAIRGAGHLRGDALRLALARAWVRYGDRDRWEPTLDALESGRLKEQVLEIRASCAEEARLLGMASQAYQKAAVAGGERTERARLLFLAGDAERRRGEAESAEVLLRQALLLAPATVSGKRAASLLEGVR